MTTQIYAVLDIIIQITFMVITYLLNGTAQKVYFWLTFAHFLSMLFINFDGSGSYLCKWFGINVEIPLAVMFFQDLTANFLDYFLPVSGIVGSTPCCHFFQFLPWASIVDHFQRYDLENPNKVKNNDSCL